MSCSTPCHQTPTRTCIWERNMMHSCAKHQYDIDQLLLCCSHPITFPPGTVAPTFSSFSTTSSSSPRSLRHSSLPRERTVPSSACLIDTTVAASAPQRRSRLTQAGRNCAGNRDASPPSPLRPTPHDPRLALSAQGSAIPPSRPPSQVSAVSTSATAASGSGRRKSVLASHNSTSMSPPPPFPAVRARNKKRE